MLVFYWPSKTPPLSCPGLTWASSSSRRHDALGTRWITTGARRLIPAGLVTHVDHDAETVTVTLSRDQVRAGPDYEEGVDADDVTLGAHSDYYGPFSWSKTQR